MTTPSQALFDQIGQLSEQEQTALAAYLKEHLEEILKQAEKEYRIATGTYTIDDFNEETQSAIRNVANRKNLILCKDIDDLYNQLDI